jgi:hypothetical protein
MADKITRLTVVDHREGGSGRVFEAWDVDVYLSLQDDGQTLKIFVRDTEVDNTQQVG